MPAKKRHRVLAWVGVVWGSFILLTGGLRLVLGDVPEGGYGAGQMVVFAFGAFMLFAGARTLQAGPVEEPDTPLHDFARRYTAAWCSQNASRVATFFQERGALTINSGPSAVGREAITASAQAFMTAFPDMVVVMDRLEEDEGGPRYHWTLIGTNTGPGGTGRAVRISGYEEWLIGTDGLIADSQGHFDEAEYQRQLSGG